MSPLKISHMYDRIIAVAVEKAYDRGYERGYRMGRLDAEIKESADITPSPSDRPPRNLRA